MIVAFPSIFKGLVLLSLEAKGVLLLHLIKGGSGAVPAMGAFTEAPILSVLHNICTASS